MGLDSPSAYRFSSCIIQQQLSRSVRLYFYSLFALYHRKLMMRYNHQNTLVSLFYRWFQDQSSWALPILYILLKDLRDLAEQVGFLSILALGLELEEGD